jgi:hypothetical protein
LSTYNRDFRITFPTDLSIVEYHANENGD